MSIAERVKYLPLLLNIPGNSTPGKECLFYYWLADTSNMTQKIISTRAM